MFPWIPSTPERVLQNLVRVRCEQGDGESWLPGGLQLEEARFGVPDDHVETQVVVGTVVREINLAGHVAAGAGEGVGVFEWRQTDHVAKGIVRSQCVIVIDDPFTLQRQNARPSRNKVRSDQRTQLAITNRQLDRAGNVSQHIPRCKRHCCLREVLSGCTSEFTLTGIETDSIGHRWVH